MFLPAFAGTRAGVHQARAQDACVANNDVGDTNSGFGVSPSAWQARKFSTGSQAGGCSPGGIGLTFRNSKSNLTGLAVKVCTVSGGAPGTVRHTLTNPASGTAGKGSETSASRWPGGRISAPWRHGAAGRAYGRLSGSPDVDDLRLGWRIAPDAGQHGGMDHDLWLDPGTGGAAGIGAGLNWARERTGMRSTAGVDLSANAADGSVGECRCVRGAGHPCEVEAAGGRFDGLPDGSGEEGRCAHGLLDGDRVLRDRSGAVVACETWRRGRAVGPGTWGRWAAGPSGGADR